MEIRLLTYNIQSWDLTKRRIDGIIDLIKRYNPDVICLQEVTMTWFSILRKELSNIYAFTGRDRFHGNQNILKRDRERNCVLYKKDRFELIWSHTYWLGPEMNKSSKFDDSVFPRVFTATYLLEKNTKQKMQVISTHFDYDLPSGREKQAGVLSNYLLKQKNPLLLAGDFNCEPKEKAHQMINAILDDVGILFKQDEITYHAYNKFPHERIDYIFKSKDIKAKEFELIKDEYEGLPPSDHYPLVSLLEIK